MNNTLLKIKSKFSEFLPYWLPGKLLISFIITSLGGASFLGFLSEYAVYNYAIYFGFRVPIEGIPYLKPTVTLISLLLFFSATIGFILIYTFAKSTATIFNIPEYLLKKLIRLIFKNNKPITINTLRDSSDTKAVFVSIIAAIIVTIIIHYINIAKDNTVSLKFIVSFDSFIFIAATIVYISTFKSHLIKYISMISGLLCIVGTLALMFSPSLYSKFLYITGFGGERDITLYVSENEKTINGKLLIKSNEFYIIKYKDEILEYPVKDVPDYHRTSASFNNRAGIAGV